MHVDDGGYRVAHFTDTYLPRRDGVVTSLHTLQAALEDGGGANLTVAPRHRQQGARPNLLTLGALPCGVADLRLGGWPLARQVAQVAAWRPEIVHVHTPGPMGLLGVLAAARLGLPLVHTYHTDLHAYADAYRIPGCAIELGVRLYARRLRTAMPSTPRAPARSVRHAALDALNELLLGGADAVVVPTPAVLERAELPVPADRIFLVPAGVARRTLTTDQVAKFRARHKIAPDDRVVLFVGRVNREKGVELLLAAFARVLAELPEARLVLVGAVYERRRLHRLLERHRLAGRVTVTGQLPPEQVAAAYANAEVFAFPSLTDTQGLVLQEAALAGVPSLLADANLHRTGALGDAALLADPEPRAYADALLALLRHPAAARLAGARARERALRHTPQRYAEAMRDVYRRCANRSSPLAITGIASQEYSAAPGLSMAMDAVILPGRADPVRGAPRHLSPTLGKRHVSALINDPVRWNTIASRTP